ncbi:MAG: hypothetical protein RLZZ385_220 [Pseudomonadota bacterium]|jgi:TPR repeat protein
MINSLRLGFPRLGKVSLLLLAGLCSAGLRADYEDGVNAALSGDYATAYREFSLAAEQGLDMAQYNLGILYYMGQGTEQDYGQAFKWTTLAAEQGHVAAQFNLAALYYEGQGTNQDRAQAFRWYESAASADHGPAQLSAARMLMEGNGTERDLVRAHVWASFALDNELEEAAGLRADIERGMSEGQLGDARRLFARMQIGL